MALTVIKPSGIDTSGNYTVTGMNVSANLSAANLSVTTSANLGAVGNVIITGGTNGYVLQTDGSGTLSWIAQAGGGTVSNIANGNSNVSIPSSNGNVNISSAGNANILVITGTGVNVAGTLDVTGNSNLGNSVVANYFTGNLYGTANLATYATTANSVAGANVSGTVGAANTAGTVTTNAQPNITSTGTLTSLSVSGNITGANLNTAGNVNAPIIVNGGTGIYLSAGPAGYINFFTTGGDKASISDTGNIIASNVIANSTVFAVTANISGNINAGNVSATTFTGALTGLASSATVAASANSVAGANVSGTVSSATTAGTVTTAAQPNITSIGTLTSVSVSGNANVGNIGTTNLVATGAGSFGANVNMSTYWINNVGYPSLNTDVATKAYVDTMISSGISYHQPVAVATTTTLATATSGTTAYNSPNGAANGIGAYISTTGTYLNIDGANVQTVGTRILVKDEANATWNGIYTYANTTAIVRATDADEYGSDSTTQFSINDYFFVQGGTVNTGISYIVSAPAGTITFGTSNITFAEFSSSQVYTAGTGLTLTGTTFSVNTSQTQVTSIGTLASLSVSGNATVGNLTAGAGAGGSITGGNLVSANYITGTLTTGAQPNITSVGTLTGLGVNGNVTASNITANTGVFTGNGSGLSSIAGANVTGAVSYATTANSVAGANVSGQVSNALVAGTVYTNAQPNITSVGSLTGLTVSNATGVVDFTTTANVTLGAVANLHISGGTNAYVLQTDGAGNLSWVAQSGGGTVSNISNGNSNVSIPAANGNVNISAVGVANVLVVTGTGANITGTANVTGNLSANNITAGSGSGGNITGGNVISANTFTASGNITSGNANLGNAVTANFFIGSGNNLSNIQGANVSGQVGNALVSGTVYTNAQPNITSVGTLTSLAVTGNTTSGNLIGPLANGNSNVYIPSSNGNINLTAVSNTTMVITGTGANITGTANISGNLSANNITAGSGTGGNITGGNLVSANYFTGTLTTAAQPNITSVGTLTGLTSTGTADLTGASNVALGPVANVHITGGTNGYVLSTDGSGTLSWVAQSGGGGSTSNISNGNSNVSIAAANGNITMSAVGNANIVTVTGTGVNVAGTLNVTGQSNLGAVGNVVITGGTANYVLSTNGAGNLSWVAPPTSANVTVDNFTGNGVQTIFTLSTTPIGINQTSVNYNGATVLRTDYTLANANITFSSAPANGSYIEVTTINLTAGGGGGTSAAAAVGYSLIFGG
jgi:hypothetical protein